MHQKPELRLSRDLLEEIVEVARRAGRATLEVYDRDEIETRQKADASPLTEADLASQEVLLEGLAPLAPGMPAVAEESKVQPAAERRGWTQAWCIDPLDGTKEFVRRNGEFTVNVALLENGRPIAGVVHAPVLARSWYGAEGVGAWARDGDADPVPIRASGSGGDELVVAASRSHPSPLLEAALATLPPHQLRTLGSSLKICMVATGEVDLYPRLGPTMEWDTAAADAVLRAAGGRVVSLELEPLAYNKDDLLNPHFLAASAALPSSVLEAISRVCREASAGQ